MHIKGVPWAKMVGIVNYWDHDDVPVYAIGNKNAKKLKQKFGVYVSKKEPY